MRAWWWMKGRKRMAETHDSHRPSDSYLPSPRPSSSDEYTKDLDRAMVVAEAKLLVRQLDQYLALIGDWATEDGSGNAAE